ncbi:hypothetical protein HYZ80_04215 [Candidatus Parcubacteria bacterium]|nr:hypothetical protein [Candidatus Parcubacteria bacterium]
MWSEWFPCTDGNRVRFMKRGDGIFLERGDGERATMRDRDYAVLMAAIGISCGACSQGTAGAISFANLSEPVVICARCSARYGVRAGKFERRFAPGESH